MTNEHPITPPPELLDEWCMDPTLSNWRDIAHQAAQWGADLELEACCEWLECNYNYPQVKPSSSRRQTPRAAELEGSGVGGAGCTAYTCCQVTADRLATIRRALEALPE